MEALTLDLGHLDDIGYTAPGSLQEEFIASFREQRSPVTLGLTADAELARVTQLAQVIRDKYENVLLLGIGGSALGARAIISFIQGPFYNLKSQGPKLFIIDNLDPVIIRETASQLDMGKTCLIYVSKSGSTPETAAAFMYFSAQIKDRGGRLEDTVIICDPGDNGINRLARSLSCRLLHLPAHLPGRYSVLSAAGLLPAAITGVNLPELLQGAHEVQQSLVQAGA
ncbi:MAG: glucose-6-phosphate isomerase, partial [Methanomassiliicoccales archaeon]